MVNTILMLLVAVLFFGFVFLTQKYRELMKNYLSLKYEVERHGKDIAGLCSAAVSVDNQLSKYNQKLTGKDDSLVYLEEVEVKSEKNSYHNAIQSAKRGSSVDELMQQYSLSREEAGFLIRLHGNV